MVHDFIVTDRHVLFPVLPLTGSMSRAMAGAPPYAWEPDKGAHVGVMAREGGAITWFRGEACYVFHVMNAYEHDGGITAEVMQFEEPPLFPHPDGRPTDRSKARARLCRWRFELDGSSDRFTQTYLSDLTGEFPRIDDRRAGLANRHGWFACAGDGDAAALSGLVHVDRLAATQTRWLMPAGDTLSEPVFVARSADAAEGDGYLLAVAWRAGEDRSDLLVFDATDIGHGPRAQVHLGHRVPDGFHGNWVGAA